MGGNIHHISFSLLTESAVDDALTSLPTKSLARLLAKKLSLGMECNDLDKLSSCRLSHIPGKAVTYIFDITKEAVSNNCYTKYI